MKKVSFIIAVAVFLSAGCSKDWLSSLQNNPNAPTSSAATPQLVLPGTLTSLVGILNGGGPNSSYEYPSVWMGYWNYAPGYSFNPIPANYIMASSTPQLWDAYYGILSNLNFIIQTANAQSDTRYANYKGIANVLSALCFKNLVDLYNDIPYSQALKAQADFYPSYDNGSDIYDSLVAKLDLTIAGLQTSSSDPVALIPANDDILYGGSMQNWILLANTIKLSLLVQQSAVSAKASFLATEAASTATIGYITADAMVNPGYTAAQPGPIWGNFGLNPNGAINTYFTYVKGNQASIDFLKKTNDTRIGYIYSTADAAPTDANFYSPLPIVFGAYQADYTGTQQQIPGGVSGMGPGLVQAPGAAAVLMSAAESYFLQAEALVYGWLSGGNTAAQTAYQNGIRSSYEYLGVGGGGAAADGYAATYYSQNIAYVAFPLGASMDSLDHTIIEQKWVALNTISPVAAYNDWRRTFNPGLNSGYPIVPVSVSPSNTQAHMPFRYLYPTEESNNNNESWTKAGGPSIDPFNDKIFWMP
jgi:Starch-binding associating with outer membrane